MDNQQKTITPRVILQMLFFIVFIPFLPLLISQQWDWWEAWVYATISILGFIISRVLAARRHPDIIAERARSMQHENTQPWDKHLAVYLGIGGGLVLLVVGLDACFDWPPTFSSPVKILALVFILAGYVLGSYALIENRFFSGTVRLQSAWPPGCLERSLPLDAAPWLRRGVIDLPGGSFLSRFAMGAAADSFYRCYSGNPHFVGRSILAG